VVSAGDVAAVLAEVVCRRVHSAYWRRIAPPALACRACRHAAVSLAPLIEAEKRAAWDEGYRNGIADEATSQDWTNGAVSPARANPYATEGATTGLGDALRGSGATHSPSGTTGRENGEQGDEK
jgi:hypothetical protein